MYNLLELIYFQIYEVYYFFDSVQAPSIYILVPDTRLDNYTHAKPIYMIVYLSFFIKL